MSDKRGSLIVRPVDLDMRKAANAKPFELRRGSVRIGAQLIAAGEKPAYFDPEGFGKNWMAAIKSEAQAKGLKFVPSVDKSVIVAEAELHGGNWPGVTIGAYGGKIKPPFDDCYAMRVTVTNDCCTGAAKEKEDPDGIVGGGWMQILVRPGQSAFWAEVLVSNCYPRAHLPNPDLADIPKLKDVLFALGDKVPHFANLVLGEDYQRCAALIEQKHDKLGDTKGFDEHPFDCINGVTYEGGSSFEVHDLHMARLNGEIVQVATKAKWRKNAAAHPGRVQVTLQADDTSFFIKPVNLRPYRDAIEVRRFLTDQGVDLSYRPGMTMSVASAVARANPSSRLSKAEARMLAMAQEDGAVFACGRCGAHCLRGHRCCGAYAGMNGEAPVERRNIHEHPEADEDEVDAFLNAKLRELDAKPPPAAPEPPGAREDGVRSLLRAKRANQNRAAAAPSPLGMYAMEQLTQDAMMQAHAAREAKAREEAKLPAVE